MSFHTASAERRPLANANITACDCQAVQNYSYPYNAKFDIFARASRNPILAKPKRDSYPQGAWCRVAQAHFPATEYLIPS